MPKKSNLVLVRWEGNDSHDYDGKEHYVDRKKMIEQNAKIGDLITIKWYRTLWKGILIKDKNPNKVLQPRTSTPLKKGNAEKAKTGNVKTEKAVKAKKGNVKTGKAKIGNVKRIKTKTGNVKTGKAKTGNAKTGKAIEKGKKSNEKNSGKIICIGSRVMDSPKRTKGKLVATVSPRTDFIVTEKEQQSPRSVIQSFRNRSSPRRLFHLPEDSGESSNDDVFDEDDEESDVDAYPTENAFESNLNTYSTENVSEENEESTVGCVSSATNELKEDEDYVYSAENEFDDDEDYVNSDENEFEEDDYYVNLSENEFEEDDSRERQSASHSSDNDIIQDYSSVIQVVTSKAKWKLMGTKGPAALARALANVILTTEELQSASLTGKRDPRGKKRKVQESKLELIKETVFKQFAVPEIFQEATWRDVKLSLTQMLKYKSKKGNKKPEEPK